MRRFPNALTTRQVARVFEQVVITHAAANADRWPGGAKSALLDVVEAAMQDVYDPDDLTAADMLAGIGVVTARDLLVAIDDIEASERVVCLRAVLTGETP